MTLSIVVACALLEVHVSGGVAHKHGRQHQREVELDEVDPRHRQDDASLDDDAAIEHAVDEIAQREPLVVRLHANGTATAGADYEAKSGSLTFAPGQTSLPVTVLVLGDIGDEADDKERETAREALLEAAQRREVDGSRVESVCHCGGVYGISGAPASGRGQAAAIALALVLSRRVDWRHTWIVGNQCLGQRVVAQTG